MIRTVEDCSKVAIVILNWNGRENTLECLQSVEAIEYPNYGVIVVDNGSSDGSVAALKKKFSNLTILETGRNLGYSGGNNVGIRAALHQEADFVLLLNNDTVVGSDLLNEFVIAAHQFPDAAAFCGKIYRYDEPDRIWWAAAHWVESKGSFVCPLEGVLDDRAADDMITETDYACGCAIFMRAALLREVGHLDARYFLTFEETDWCFRVRRAGYRCFLVPKAKLWHKGSASFSGDGSPLYSYFYTRNRLLFAERYLGLRARTVVWRKTVGQVTAWALAPLRGSQADWKQRYRLLRDWIGHLDEWWKTPGFWATRLAIRDYLLRRFGDCPDIVRELNRAKI